MFTNFYRPKYVGYGSVYTVTSLVSLSGVMCALLRIVAVQARGVFTINSKHVQMCHHLLRVTYLLVDVVFLLSSWLLPHAWNLFRVI